MFNKIEKVCDIRSVLGEGPCWDSVKNKIYWVDIIKKNIHFFDFNSNKSETIELNKFVGSIGLRKNGGIIAALEDGFYFIEDKSKTKKLIIKVDENINKKRFNDGKVDCLGNFWAGSVSYEENLPIGILYCLTNDFKFKKALDNITISNGITWSLDNKKMYFIDTPTLKVDVFDFDIYENKIFNRKVAFEIPKNLGFPDGMTIDVEGKLWIAHWGNSKVFRWDPTTKKIIDKIDIPAIRVSSCTFGGKNLDNLFITTAQRGFAENIEDYSEKDSGYIYMIQTKTRGLDTFRFDN